MRRHWRFCITTKSWIGGAYYIQNFKVNRSHARPDLKTNLEFDSQFKNFKISDFYEQSFNFCNDSVFTKNNLTLFDWRAILHSFSIFFNNNILALSKLPMLTWIVAVIRWTISRAFEQFWFESELWGGGHFSDFTIEQLKWFWRLRKQKRAHVRLIFKRVLQRIRLKDEDCKWQW